MIGVPSNDFAGQEPGSSEQIAEFCNREFGVTFPMAARQVVTGEAAHPLYQWARVSVPMRCRAGTSTSC